MSCYFISVPSVIYVAAVTILKWLQYFFTRYDLLHNAHLKLEGLDELYRVAKVHHTPGSLQHKYYKYQSVSSASQHQGQGPFCVEM